MIFSEKLHCPNRHIQYNGKIKCLMPITIITYGNSKNEALLATRNEYVRLYCLRWSTFFVGSTVGIDREWQIRSIASANSFGTRDVILISDIFEYALNVHWMRGRFFSPLFQERKKRCEQIIPTTFSTFISHHLILHTINLCIIWAFFIHNFRSTMYAHFLSVAFPFANFPRKKNWLFVCVRCTYTTFDSSENTNKNRTFCVLFHSKCKWIVRSRTCHTNHFN